LNKESRPSDHSKLVDLWDLVNELHHQIPEKAAYSTKGVLMVNYCMLIIKHEIGGLSIKGCQ
jgi:hypothetical protein